MAMAGALPPIVAVIAADTRQFSAGMAKVRGEMVGAQTTGNAAFAGLAGVGKLAFLGIAGAAVIGGAAALKMGSDFQTSMTQLVTGAGESRSNIDLVSKGILNMAGQVGQSAQNLASGMYMIESAGFHGASGLQVLQASAEGARVGGADMAVVANAVTTALNAYGMSGSQAASITSQMTATVAAGKMHLQDLAGALSAVLPVAASVHLSFAQVGGAMATMTANGVSAQEAAQNVSSTIRSIINPSQQAVGMMEQLGLSSVDLAQHIGDRGLTGTLDVLVKAVTAKMGPSGLVIMDTFKKSEAAAKDARTMIQSLPSSLQSLASAYMSGTIPQKEWRSEMMKQPVAIREMGMQFAGVVNQTRGFNDLLKSGRPDAETFAATMGKLLGGATGLNTALQLTGTHMGTFDANVKSISGAVPEAGNHVKGWAETQKDLSLQVDKTKDKFLAWITTIGLQLIPIASKALGMINNFTDFLNQHQEAVKVVGIMIMSALVPAIGAYVISMGMAAVATLAAMWPLLAIMAVAALVGGAVYLIISHWSQIGGFFGRIFGVVGGLFSHFGAMIHGALNSILHVAENAWKEFSSRPIYWITRLILFIPLEWLKLEIWLAKFLINLAINTAKGFANLVVAAVNEAKRLPGQIGDLFSRLGTTLHNKFNDFVNGARQDVPKIVDAIKNAFLGLPGDMANIGKNIIQGLIGGVTGMISAAKNAAGQVAGGVLDSFKSVLGIHSPSTAMMAAGREVPAGAALGILGNAGVVASAMSTLSNSVSLAGTTGAFQVGVAGGGAGGGAFSSPGGKTLDDIFSEMQEQTNILIQVGQLLAREHGPVSNVEAELAKAVARARKTRSRGIA